MIFLDSKYNFVSQEIICKGSIEQVKPDMSELIEKVIRRHCPIVMLTHNHPSGSEIPSSEDKKLTRYIYNLLFGADIYLADHTIENTFYKLTVDKYNNLTTEMVKKDDLTDE
jgi:DNA repair protein RadC